MDMLAITIQNSAAIRTLTDQINAHQAQMMEELAALRDVTAVELQDGDEIDEECSSERSRLALLHVMFRLRQLLLEKIGGLQDDSLVDLIFPVLSGQKLFSVSLAKCYTRLVENSRRPDASDDDKMTVRICRDLLTMQLMLVDEHPAGRTPDEIWNYAFGRDLSPYYKSQQYIALLALKRAGEERDELDRF